MITPLTRRPSEKDHYKVDAAFPLWAKNFPPPASLLTDLAPLFYGWELKPAKRNFFFLFASLCSGEERFCTAVGDVYFSFPY